jgi:hypothetical protein
LFDGAFDLQIYIYQSIIELIINLII